MIVTKSQVESWDTTHLDEAASHWLKVAGAWENSFSAVHDDAQSPGGTEFTGQFASALRAKTKANLNMAEDITAHLRYAANAAQFGKGDIDQAKSQAQEAISNADDEGFLVDETLETVTPKNPSSNPEELAYQMHQAAQHLGAIQVAVRRLTAADIETSEGIMRATNGIQAVDFKTDEPSVPEINGPDDDTLIGAGDGASTQSGLGSEDTRLPDMPRQWPPVEPEPPQPEPRCGPLETARDTFDNVAATAGETAGALLLPVEGAAAIPSAIGLAKGAEVVAQTSDTLINCLERQ